jgi:hypothetical protein
MNVTLSLYHFEGLLKSGYTLDMVFLLKLAEEGHDIKELCKGNEKMEVIYQSVYRKALVSKDNKVTIIGRNLLEFLKEKAPKNKTVKKIPASEDFKRWWKAYPGTDTFRHKNKAFGGSRSLRRDEENCKIKFNAILSQGEYTADELIAALELDVLQKKDKSVATGDNKLSFMQNSLTYLIQRSYEPFIELVKEQITSKPIGSTDI